MFMCVYLRRVMRVVNYLHVLKAIYAFLYFFHVFFNPLHSLLQGKDKSAQSVQSESVYTECVFNNLTNREAGNLRLNVWCKFSVVLALSSELQEHLLELLELLLLRLL